MKKSCLAWFTVYVIAAVGFAAFLFVRFPQAPPSVSPRLPPVPMRAAMAAGWGLVCALPALLGLAGLDGIRVRLGERARLLAAAAGAPPRDGVVGPFVGRMAASRAAGGSETLTAPLSGRECRLYHYQASHTSGGKSSSQVTDAEGYALAPSAIETLTGLVELRAYMDLDFAPETFEAAPSRERLAEHQRTATLFQPTFNLVRNYRESQSYLLDDDGAIRYDHGSQGSADEATRFEEHVVQTGDEVVVFGLYSAARNAVVPDPQSEVLRRARLLKGGPSRVAWRLTTQAIVSGVVGALLLAAGGGLVYLFFVKAAEFTV